MLTAPVIDVTFINISAIESIFSQLPAGIATTPIRPRRIYAQLRNGALVLPSSTLVNINATVPISREFIPLIAFTAITSFCIDASLAALIQVVRCAFVYINAAFAVVSELVSTGTRARERTYGVVADFRTTAIGNATFVDVKTSKLICTNVPERTTRLKIIYVFILTLHYIPVDRCIDSVRVCSRTCRSCRYLESICIRLCQCNRQSHVDPSRAPHRTCTYTWKKIYYIFKLVFPFLPCVFASPAFGTFFWV